VKKNAAPNSLLDVSGNSDFVITLLLKPKLAFIGFATTAQTFGGRRR
jgi:hypothetical protein